MANYQRIKLVRAVLVELGAIDANSTPEAADQTLVNDTAQQKLEALYEDGLIPFNLDGQIPARYFRPLVQIVANELVAAFGKVGRAQVLAVGKADGMRELRRLKDQADDNATTRAVYY